VESWNNKLKCKIKQFHGLEVDKREAFLKEFMWLDFYKEKAFEQI